MCVGGKGGQRSIPFSEKQMAHAKKPKSQETRNKISKTLMGKCYITEEGLKILTERMKGNQYAKGNSHKLTEATKAKMSKARMGIQYSEVTLQRMRENRKGKGIGDRNGMASQENRDKVRDSKIGLRVMYNSNRDKRMAKPGTVKSDVLLSQGYFFIG
jgi:hypothetical protein